MLHTALERAAVGKKAIRNVAGIVKAQKVPQKDVAVLRSDQIGELLNKIRDHRLYTLVVVALGTGLRRGELRALRWRDIDLEARSLRVERSLGEAEGKLYFRSPKSQAGRRSLSLAATVVEALRTHRRRQMEDRLRLGLARLPREALVYCDLNGQPLSPDKISRDWARLVRQQKLPAVSFHGLRHTRVSALVEGGFDEYVISRRIGHGSASLTLKAYTHLFRSKEDQAAEAIESA